MRFLFLSSINYTAEKEATRYMTLITRRGEKSGLQNAISG